MAVVGDVECKVIPGFVREFVFILHSRLLYHPSTLTGKVGDLTQIGFRKRADRIRSYNPPIGSLALQVYPKSLRSEVLWLLLK